MDDNATCHRTLAVQDCLDSEGIQRLVWPARSPDLNPIENVWDALGRQVAGRNYPPTNKNTLIRALTEEWDKLPQQLLDNVVQNYLLPLSSTSILSPFRKSGLCTPLITGTLNSRRGSSPLLRLVEGEEVAGPCPPRVFSLTIGVKPSKIVLSPVGCSKLQLTTGVT
ncbi:hypothetical protein TNCV_877701 [Trichonephila clavipes]|nr:hypothetical protein TNCV_877701 [Trichonephila clavipes]